MRDLFEIIGWRPRDGREIIVDSFAGGGGASLGIKLALGRDPDVAINHDPEAVALHQANHPGTRHHCQSVWEASPRQVTLGLPVGLLWASPDCKHFSKAKGGKPVSRNIRDLAWVVVKWAREVFPRVIILENVEEFVTWGPLGPDGRPDPERKGEEFHAWVRALRELRYTVEWRELVACDYGAPTTRKRLFVVARRDGMPIVWPAPTHGNPKSRAVREGRLLPWRTAAECIDWTIPCPSIFERKRDLAENTLRRIATGVDRYVVNSRHPFLVQYNGCSESHPLDIPMRAQTSRDRHALVTPYLTEHANGSKQRTWDIQEPLRTQCAHVKGGHFALLSPALVTNTTGHAPRPVGEPVPTLATGGHQLLAAASLVKFQENSVGLSPDEPLHTVMAGAPRFAMTEAFLFGPGGREAQCPPRDPDLPLRSLTAKNDKALAAVHLDRQFGRSRGNAVDAPLGTTTAGGGGKSALVAANMVKLRGTSTVARADEPVHTLSAQGTHHGLSLAHLDKFYNTAHGQPVDQPAHTVTSKHRLGLVQSRTGGDHFEEVRALLCRLRPGPRSKPWGFRVDEFDDLIKDAFEAEVVLDGEVYRIRDIGMRMLQPRELARAQGFPDSYRLDVPYNGKTLTKTAQVRMLGNSVCPPLAEALAGANVPEMAEVEGVA